MIKNQIETSRIGRNFAALLPRLIYINDTPLYPTSIGYISYIPLHSHKSHQKSLYKWTFYQCCNPILLVSIYVNGINLINQQTNVFGVSPGSHLGWHRKVVGIHVWIIFQHSSSDHIPNFFQWIGLRENLQETPIFNGKNNGVLQIFPQSNDWFFKP